MQLTPWFCMQWCYFTFLSVTAKERVTSWSCEEEECEITSSLSSSDTSLTLYFSSMLTKPSTQPFSMQLEMVGSEWTVYTHHHRIHNRQSPPVSIGRTFWSERVWSYSERRVFMAPFYSDQAFFPCKRSYWHKKWELWVQQEKVTLKILAERLWTIESKQKCSKEYVIQAEHVDIDYTFVKFSSTYMTLAEHSNRKHLDRCASCKAEFTGHNVSFAVPTVGGGRFLEGMMQSCRGIMRGGGNDSIYSLQIWLRC